ncbi:hypothetical protein C8J57DRAFT_1520820 [Mycena rebaudengoi]|nr:hypothetical protein C8J57DRAFT_1520820 [Mycena rebaudengoi]
MFPHANTVPRASRALASAITLVTFSTFPTLHPLNVPSPASPHRRTRTLIPAYPKSAEHPGTFLRLHPESGEVLATSNTARAHRHVRHAPTLPERAAPHRHRRSGCARGPAIPAPPVKRQPPSPPAAPLHLTPRLPSRRTVLPTRRHPSASPGA